MKIKFTYRKWFVLIIAFLFVGTNVLSFTGHSGMQKESMDTALSFEIPIDRVSQPEIQKSLLDSEPWWNTNWTYRKNITIDHIKVSGDLQNFPVLMNNISSDFTQHAQPDGDDFVFVDSTNTVLYNHEIESYDSVTGELLVWVNIASLSSTVDTVIWMYYGNPTCTNQQNPIGTWDSDYQMVQHLKDTTSSTTIDSTSNNNNGTKKAVNEPTESIGKIGKAQDLDGTDDIITVNDNAGLSTLGPISVEAWIKTSDGISDQGIISKDAGSSGTREWLLMTSYSPPNPAIGFYLHSFTPSNYLNVWTKVINFADNTWHHVVATWDGTNAAGHIQIYIDGISRTLYNDAKIGTGCTPFDGTAPVEIGRSYAFDSTCFDGNIDESRVSKVLRSAIWISTEYNNQNSPLTFSSISNEQHRPLVADFTFSPEIPLTMELVYFISTSYVLGGYITDWAWDFGDGNTSFIEYPTHIYTSCGVYAVSLCVKDNDNGEDTITKSITINSPPIADFTISSTNPFTSEVISFSDTSTDLCGSIVARFWDFGDGTFCPEQFSLQTIKHYYLTSGNYTASLRVTDNNGTMNSTTKTICVSLGFSSDIYVDDDYVDYLPEWGTTHFNTIHNGIDVAIETGSIYVFNGFYPEHLMVDKSIRLTGENNEATIVDGSNTGNVFTITENDIILSGFKVQYGGNAGVSLQSTSNVIISGNSIVNNGNGIDVHTTSNMNYISENTINENNRGVFIYDDSNENTISKNIIFGNTQDGIRIEHLCVENQIFENTISQCANGIYLYDACNNNKIYHNNLMDNTKNARDYCTINYWDDGYPSGGNYWSDYYGVDVSPKDGIGDSPYSVFGGPNKDHYPYMYSTGWINKHPMAGFTYSPENPTTDNFVTFTDTSEDLDGIVVSWLWEFGDGNISTLQNPTHQYADDGNYLISLTVTDNYGAINTTYRSIIVSTITNHAPYKPSNPIPADGAINVDFTEAIISWYGGDPDLGDYVRYHIYFGIDPENLDYYGATPFFPSNNSDPFTHNFGFSLNSGTIYYWGIIAEDDEYVPTNGPLWSYTTAGQSISADFTFTPENPMNTSLIHFTDTSTDYDGIIISWWWNFDDHYYSDLQNPVHCYYEDGIYNVTLTVTDDDGATSSITKMIVVGETNQPPAANFTYAPSQPTTADTIQFTDTSVDSDGNIVFWLWNFGDSNTSNTQNPTHRYQIPGTYPVTLTVTDNDGATNTTTKPITINEGFIAKWNFDEGTGSTAHDTSGYNNHGTIYGGDWVPGISGTALEITNTDIVRNIPGAFDDPITTSFTISGWVHWYGPTGLPTEDSSIFDARKGSGGGFVIYLKASGAVEFFLIKSDNSLQVIRSNTVLPANAGWAHITGVFDQTTQTLRLYINGVEDSASPVVASAPYSQTTLTASIGNNRWAPGDHQWSPLNGKLDELCIYNRALSPLEIHYLYEQYASNQPPIANFNYTPQNPTTLDIISFTDISNDPDGTIVSWDWDFGNGNPSALQNPTHQYSIAETYSVTLTVSDDDGATDSITKQITITDDLIACWHFDEGEGSIAHDTSTFGNDGTIYGTDWVPGVSGSALDITDTDIIRFIPDTFDDPINTAFTISGWVYWYGPHGYPTDCSIFDGRTNANAGFALYIHIDGTVGFFLRKPDGSVQDIRSTTVLPINNKWTYIAGVFDQTTQTLRLYINGIEDAASPVYAPYPYYHSTLTATIGNNRWAPGDHQWSPLNGKLDEIYIYKRSLSSQEIHNVYEHYAPNQPPIADFTYTPENPTTNHVILFSDTSSDSDGTIVNWTWDFGDGTVSYDQNPTYQYLDHIAYTVVLMVTDDDGETDSISKSVIVHNAEPLASFTYIPENPSNIDFIQFIDTSTDPDGTIVSWLWDFGDDNISTEQNPTYRYTTAGTYIVTLSATDDDGATDSIGKNIIVIETGPSVNWIEMQKLFAPSGVARDNFGWSVSLDDDTALIGVPGDDTSKGSTYVFIRTGDTWTQQQKLLASDGQANDHFGESVSLDGDTALIGAYGDDNEKGSAYVFTRIGTTWTQQAKLIASDGAAGDEFGFYVSLDNDTALIGAVADDDIGSISGSAYIFTRAGTTWTQQQKLHAADGESQDRFGFSVSLEDDTALIGAIYGDGIKVDSGSAYVFIRTGITWTQQQKLFASDGAPYDIFGHSVSLSGDTALIGARFDETYSGSAYVFTASGTTWTQQQKLTASDPGVDDSFGISVSLKGDTALIGAMDEISGDNSGAAYVFTRTGTTWTQQAKLLPSDGAPGDWFGGRVSLFDDTALIGAAWDDDNGYNSGSAYIFTKEGVNQPPIANFTYTPENPTTTDIIQFTDTSTDNDGTIASWHWDFSDGNISTVQNPTYSYTTAGTYPITLFVTDDDGATDSIEKTIIVIETGPSVNWTEIQKLLPSDITENDEFGRSPSIDGNTAFIGAPGFTDGTKKGSVYVFTRTDNTWTQQQKILASDGASGDHFGFSISLKGNTALIGAINGQGVAVNSGSTYVFTCSGGTWTQQAKLIAPDGGTGDMFGMWVSLDEDTALIGAPHNGGGIGAAYVFTRTGTTWTQQQKLTASDGSPGDVFGASASLDGDTAALGAYYADGIVSTTGCMYIFVRTGTTWTQQQKLFASDGSSGDVFGHSVCVDGNTAIAGARFDENYYGSEYVFIRIGTTWTQQQKLTAQDGGAHDSFGEFAALDGDTALIGASDEIYGGSGAAYVFTRSGTTWTPQARLLPSDGVDGDFFSLGVALNGDTIFIGAPYKNDLSGSAYIFTKEGVNQQPASNFTYTPENPTISDTIIFTDTSYDPDGTITSWLWDFGDGNNSVIQNPTYQYTTIGEFSIVLTITDNDGATANITRLLTVTIAGDLDHDDDVDEDDFWVFVAAFGRSIGDPLYNPEADYNHNGVIDLVDYQIWLQYYRAFNNISTDGPDFEEEPLDEFYQDQISIDQQQSLDMNTSTQNMSSPNKISKLHDLQNISNIEIEIEIPHDSFDPIAGDLDHDGDVDNDDFTLLAQAFNHSTGDTLYDPEGDYDYDGTITYIDYQIWLGYYRDFNELM